MDLGESPDWITRRPPLKRDRRSGKAYAERCARLVDRLRGAARAARMRAHRSVNEIRDVCAAFWGAHVLDVTIDELFTGRHTGPSLVGRGLFTGAPNEGSQ